MLSIQTISLRLSGKTILNALDLQAEKGQIVGILGRNGAGKTTLFRTLAGDYRPEIGQVLFENLPLSKNQVAFLETDPYFYPFITGREYLQLIQNTPEKIEHWAAILDLPLEDLADNYSTGMQKKLALAGAFLQNRPLMLLDEPFNGVDLESNAKIMAILNEVKKKREKTVLISSHILSTLTDTCDVIAVLEKGQVTEIVAASDFGRLTAAFAMAAYADMGRLLD